MFLKNNICWITWGFTLALIGAGVWGGYRSWQYVYRLPVEGATVFRAALSVHPVVRPGLNVIEVDIGAPSQLAGELLVRLRRTEKMTSTPAAEPQVRRDGGTALSVIDLNKILPRDGWLASWEVAVDHSETVRLKIWRQEGDIWSVVGESPLASATKGMNHFSIQPPLVVREGDYLGFYTTWTSNFPVQLDSRGSPSSGKVYVNGDFHQQIPEAKMSRDIIGNYKFRAFYSPVGSGKELLAVLRPQPGVTTYRLELPPVAFTLEGMELCVEARQGARAFIYPALRHKLRGDNLYVGTLYDPSCYDRTARGIHWRAVSISAGKTCLDLFCVGITLLGAVGLMHPGRGRWRLVMASLPAFLALAIWVHPVSASPLARQAPAILSMFFLPGFIVLELVFSRWSQRLDPLERVPLMFGLGLAVWTLLAVPAYRLQWFSDAVIGGMLAAMLLGLVILYYLKVRNGKPLAEKESRRTYINPYYLGILILVLIIAAIVSGYTAQFQGECFDTYYHLAGYRKVADNVRIIGGDMMLGSGNPGFVHYSSNPWYLVFGLAARLARLDIIWLYVGLAAVMTIMVFLVFYMLLKALVREPNVAAVGTLMVAVPWISELAWTCLSAYYFAFQFLPYPSTLCQLILLPLALVACFHYGAWRNGTSWGAVCLLSLATMGQHACFIAWVPLVLGMALGMQLLLGGTFRQRAETGALILAIGIIAALLAYLMTTFPLAAKLPPSTEAETLKLWAVCGGGFWKLSDAYYACDPRYVLQTGWLEIAGMALLAWFMIRRNRMKADISTSRCMPADGNGHLFLPSPPWIIVAAAFFSTWLIAFNPLVVPWIIHLLNWSIVVYRILGCNTVLSHVILYGALACLIFWLSCLCRKTGQARFARMLPLVGILACIIIPLLIKPVRAALVAVVQNRGWYASMIDLSTSTLYRQLSALEPGTVAVEFGDGLPIVALTPHYVVADLHIGDHRIIDERRRDNDAIINFLVPRPELVRLLEKYQCRYVVVPRGNPARSLFQAQADLFSEIPGDKASVFVLRPTL